MVINHKMRWVFISPPKTASTTLTSLLVEQHGGEVHAGRHCVRIPPECVDYLIIVSVRNPYTRAQSLYRHRVLQLCRQQFDTNDPRRQLRSMENPRDLLEFADFVTQLQSGGVGPFYAFSLSRWLRPVPRVDAVLHVESLRLDLFALPFVNSTPEIPHRNRTDGLTCLDVDYTPQTARGVQEWAGADFAQFGYDLEKL